MSKLIQATSKLAGEIIHIFHAKFQLNRYVLSIMRVEKPPKTAKKRDFANFSEFGDPVRTPCTIRAKFDIREFTHGILYHDKFYPDR